MRYKENEGRRRLCQASGTCDAVPTPFEHRPASKPHVRTCRAECSPRVTFVEQIPGLTSLHSRYSPPAAGGVDRDRGRAGWWAKRSPGPKLGMPVGPGHSARPAACGSAAAAGRGHCARRGRLRPAPRTRLRHRTRRRPRRLVRPAPADLQRHRGAHPGIPGVPLPRMRDDPSAAAPCRYVGENPLELGRRGHIRSQRRNDAAPGDPTSTPPLE